jgi:hypothetical protein
LFEACPSVWALGPQPVTLQPSPVTDPVELALWRQNGAAGTNGNGAHPPETASPAPTEAAVATPGVDEAGTEPPMPATAPPSVPSVPVDESRTEFFRWFETAFDGLRQEVESLRASMAEEKEIVGTLVHGSQTEATLGAESMAVIATTVRRAVRLEVADVKNELAATLAEVRTEIAALKESGSERAAELAATLAELRSDVAALKDSGSKRAAELKASIAEAATAGAGLPDELDRRDAANRKAFRATFEAELQPIVEVVAESVALSEHGLESLRKRLDALIDVVTATADRVDAMAEAAEEPAVVLPVRPAPRTTARRVSLRSTAQEG